MRQYQIMIDGDIDYYKDFGEAWLVVEKIIKNNGFHMLTPGWLKSYLDEQGSYTFDIFNQITYRDYE